MTSGGQNWRVLPASNEVIWYSQRDDWGQLYLYDLTTGQLKHPITRGKAMSGAWSASTNGRARSTSMPSGKEPGRDPYFLHLYKVGFDGKGLALLTPEVANHQISLAPVRGVLRRSLLDAGDATRDGPPVRHGQADTGRSSKPTCRASAQWAGNHPRRSP